MKKILSISIATTAIMFFTASCKKTDPAGGGTTPPPATTHTNAILVKTVSDDSIQTAGGEVPIGTFTLTVRDSAIKTINLTVTSASSIFNNNTVRVEIGNAIKSDMFSYNGTFGNVNTFYLSPFSKKVVVGVYTVKVFGTPQITGTMDSASVSLKIGAKEFNDSVAVEGQKMTFVNSSVYVQKSASSPQTKSIAPANTTIQMLATDVRALGRDQSPSSVKVITNNPLITLIQIKLNGSIIGSATVTANTMTKITLTGGTILQGTTKTLEAWAKFKDFSGTEATGVATTVQMSNLELKDNANAITIAPGTYTSDPQYVFKTLFSITGTNTIQQNVPGSKMTAHKATFSVSGADGATKQIGYKMTWAKSTADTLSAVLSFEEDGLDITNNVWFTNQNGDTLTALTANESTTKVFVTFKSGNGESVISGSKNYELKAIAKGFLHDGSALQCEIDQDIYYVAPTTLSYYPGKPFQVTLNGTASNIVISDMSMNGSNGIVGLTKSEFFGGYLVTNTSGISIIRK